MVFEIDVLIAFADRDNETNSKNELGWVSQFKKFLELMLTQVLGEKPNVMIKADYDNLVSPKLDNVGVLVAILSKDFIESGKCLDHVESFYKAIESTSKKKNRAFKVLKTPLSTQEQPPRLRDSIGYDMYQLDPDSGETKEYTDYFSTEAERQYWMKMVDLAYDIYERLLALKDDSSSAEVKNIYKRKTIYLAETGHDLSVQRNIIKRELLRHGYQVLPNQTLPSNAGDLERVVQKELNESALSIHLIGNAYGEIPEGTDRSVVDIQNKLAAEKSIQAKENKEEFGRLVWISPNLTLASEKQKAFIENIKRDAEVQEGAEILQTSLEDFKNIMREELVDAGEKKPVTEGSGQSIYVMHDKVDRVAVKPLIDVMEKSGFTVLMPDYEGELLELRQKHINNLKNLDGAIIYKGNVNEQWVRMKALDLLKAPGFGRKKPILAKAIFTTIGSNLNNESFRSQNLRVVEGDAVSSIESLKSFLKEFNV
ncbi:MAG TPA: DUF4062 domain-containing protein [Chryseolinea sp.]|nr:DUF4062 domain-containing protein [Chryseolinea sp.]HPH46478.1 DUF4062 domain-containing protein [Chryseolinea sp.]HPM32626.1 DUF4062 domain-containing protein [Chryseolinea sp.]